MNENHIHQERMKEIEIFGIPALFSSNRIPRMFTPECTDMNCFPARRSPAAPAIWPRTAGMILWERY